MERSGSCGDTSRWRWRAKKKGGGVRREAGGVRLVRGQAVRAAQHHLLDAVETLAVEAEGLFKENPVLHRPLVRERSEVGEVGQGLLHVVLVPKEHPQGLGG